MTSRRPCCNLTLSLSKAASPVARLEAQSHIEVFRNMGLASKPLHAVDVHERALLHRLPPQEGVVADERGDVAAAHAHLRG